MILKKRIKPRFDFKSLSILLYFIGIIAINQYDVIGTKLFYYLTLFSCALTVFFQKEKMPPILLLLCLGTFGIGLSNILFVGNLSLLRLLIVILAFPLAYVFLSNNVDSKYLVIAVYLNAAIVLYHFAVYGIDAPVYENISNNYVSIHMLAPMVIYYMILEKNGQSVPIFPAFLIWIISIFAGGRGGVLTATILFFGIVYLKLFEKKHSKFQKAVIIVSILALFSVVAIPMLSNATENYSNLRIVRHFDKNGFESVARIQIWIEYASKTIETPQNFLIGTDLRSILSAAQFDWNLHNSFLFVHAYFGVLGFLFILYWLLKDTLYCIKYKKWVYFLCLVTFSLRAATDHVFGGNRLSPIYICLLLYPYLSTYCCSLNNNHSMVVKFLHSKKRQ